MSTIADPPTAAEPAAAARPPAAGRSARAWLRVALACGLLAAAGAVRAWQGRQVKAFMDNGRNCPFALDDLPKQLGPWAMIDAQTIDPAIKRGAGAADFSSRTYADDRTGVALATLVLYGPALQMHIHAPTVCYPAAGYSLAEGPDFRDITYTRKDGTQVHATASALTFTRGEGPAAERKQVYYAWGHDGLWSPHLLGPKAYQRVPGMFKVHIERRCAAGETLDADNPCESLLRSLLPEIDNRVAEAEARFNKSNAKPNANAAAKPKVAAAR